MSDPGIRSIRNIKGIKGIKSIKDTKRAADRGRSSLKKYKRYKDLNTNYTDYTDYTGSYGVQKGYFPTPQMRGMDAFETAIMQDISAQDRILKKLVRKLAINNPVLQPKNSLKMPIYGCDKCSYRNHEA